jgi:hypothetical protein
MSTSARCTLALVLLFSLGVARRPSAQLKDDQYDRFYARYVGHYTVNLAKSRYIKREAPKEPPSHTYSAIAGKKGITYNKDVVHLLDGQDYPLGPGQPGATVARQVLDEFTVSNTIRRNGQIASRNTLVLSENGTFAVMTFIDISERGEPSVASIVYYDKTR